MAKQNYYSIENLLKTESTYNLLLGERSNGKSYAVKKLVLWESFHKADYLKFLTTKKIVPKKRYKFGYMRRWKDEIKSRNIEQYFEDMPIEEITDGQYTTVICYRGDIYFGNVENGKNVRGELIGSTFALNVASHYKSLAFPEIGNIVFEEFLTNEGYLNTETSKLESIVSTIARRELCQVFMIGNTINRMCPYFDEWQLTHIKKQEIGTIDIYNQHTDQYDDNNKQIIVKIAVEYCGNSGNNSHMFFGNSAKSINGGCWDTNVYPHLQGSLRDYKRLYQVDYEYSTFGFIINLLVTTDNEPFLFVYPKTKTNDKIQRKVSDKFTTDIMTTSYLTELTKYDTLVLQLLRSNKVVYSDNLTGTEFEQLKKDKGGY